MTSFKIYIGNEIRRFRLDLPKLNYESFTEKLKENIPSYCKEMKTVYEDGDKEKIVFSSEQEFQEMLSHLEQLQNGKLELVKIWIDLESPQPFKDGTVELAYACVKAKDQVVEKLAEYTPSHARIQSAIERLFPENKILPYHIPAYLQEVLKINTLANHDVDLDIDVQGVAQAINTEALNLMNSPHPSDLAKSKFLLQSLAMIREDDPNVNYNLACADSLLQDVKSSLEQLQIACQKGYSNFKHLVEDPDLAFLRMHDQYQQFIAAVMPNRVEQKEPVAPVEEKPEPVAQPEALVDSLAVEQEKEVALEVAKPERWGDEIEVLKGMGFQLQDSVFVDVLDHHKGNVERAVQDLI